MQQNVKFVSASDGIAVRKCACVCLALEELCRLAYSAWAPGYIVQCPAGQDLQGSVSRLRHASRTLRELGPPGAGGMQ